jgi:uncharacterized membrane protein YGL010W
MILTSGGPLQKKTIINLRDSKISGLAEELSFSRSTCSVGIFSLLVNYCINYVGQGVFNTSASPATLDGMVQ